MNNRTQKVWEIVEPVVEGMGYEFVGVEFIANGKHSVLRIYIDKPEGITVEDCAAISHQASGVFDVENPIDQSYTLEVSSPGLNRPLFRAEDYERFAGEPVKIRLRMPMEGRRNFAGKLLGFQDGMVRIDVEDVVVELLFEQIERARLVPQY